MCRYLREHNGKVEPVENRYFEDSGNMSLFQLINMAIHEKVNWPDCVLVVVVCTVYWYVGVQRTTLSTRLL